MYVHHTFKDANKKKESKKIALKCLHKIETKEQIKNNILWEKNYRNTILRDALPNCSIICSYPINDILSTIKGESSIYSEWMADLLEILMQLFMHEDIGKVQPLINIKYQL